MEQAAATMESDPGSQTRISNLQLELDSALQEIEIQRQQVETYMSIAKTAEEKLNDHHEAYKKYEQTMAENIRSLQQEKEDLESRLEHVSAEKDRLAEELEVAKTEFSERQAALAQRIQELESSNSQLSASERNAVQNMNAARQDMQRQRQMADEAASNYESELMKHAKSMQMIAKLKEEMSRIQAERDQLSSQVNNAGANLKSAQQSWIDQKTIMDKQVADAQARISELSRQNELLHSQLEEMGKQLGQLRRPLAPEEFESLVSTNAEMSSIAGDSTQKAVDELRELVKLLNRDKEIVKYEHEATVQTAKRLELQLSQTTKALEQARLDLSDERERYRNGHTLSSSEFEEFQGMKEQVNVLRDSNRTLRSEYEKELQRAKSFEAEMTQLRSKLGPMMAQVRDANAKLKAQTETIATLTADNEQWKNRTQEILTKYDQIDPEEHRRLVEEHEQLKSEFSSAQMTFLEKETSFKQAEDRVQRLQTISQQWKNKAEQYEGLMKAMNDKLTASSGDVNELKAQIQTLESERDELLSKVNESQSEVDSLKKAFETERTELSSKITRINDIGLKYKKLCQQKDMEIAELKENQATTPLVDEEREKAVTAEYEAKIAEMQTRFEQQIAQTKSEVEMRYSLKESMAKKKIERLEKENQEIKARLDGPATSVVQQEPLSAVSSKRVHEETADISMEPVEEPINQEPSGSPAQKKMRTEGEIIEDIEPVSDAEDSEEAFEQSVDDYETQEDYHDEDYVDEGEVSSTSEELEAEEDIVDSVLPELEKPANITVEEPTNHDLEDLGELDNEEQLPPSAEVTSSKASNEQLMISQPPTPPALPTNEEPKKNKDGVIITSSGTVIQKITFDRPTSGSTQSAPATNQPNRPSSIPTRGRGAARGVQSAGGRGRGRRGGNRGRGKSE